MSREIYVHSEDCSVIRDHEEFNTNLAVLMDCDGDIVFSVPKEYSDEQIFYILNLVNTFYSKGIKYGEENKAYQIRKILGI